MKNTVLVVFTDQLLDDIVRDRASRGWRLDPARARKAEYLVCTRNQHNQGFGPTGAPHGAAFLIGRIAGIAPSHDRAGRWDVAIGEYTALDPPISNIWGKPGTARYPVRYTTLEQLGIALDALPPFTAFSNGMSEMPLRPLVAAANWTPTSETEGAPAGGAWRRLDAILAQLDRVPELTAPRDPLEWDEFGLPR